MILYWELFGVIFTLFIGTLLHFTYEWSGRNIFAGAISATDESTFQHLKLLFMPFIIWSIIEFTVFGQYVENFIPAKTFSVLAGMIIIVLLFYGYIDILGKDMFVLDIAIFIISVVASFFLSFILLNSTLFSQTSWIIFAKLLLAAMFLSFILFTENPPPLELFRDPTKKKS